MTEEKRRAPVRKVRVDDLGLAGYEGWWFEARTSMRVDEYIVMQGQFIDGRLGQSDLAQFVADRLIAWNFVDENGDDLPPDIEGVKQTELAVVTEINNRIWAAITQVPLAPKES